LGLGSLKYVNDPVQFIQMSFFWKFMCGLGAGINSTSSMAIVTTHYKNEREKAIGLIEASSGIGLLLGPFFGALLYEIGGYVLPFIATAGLYFLLYPLIAYTLATINEAEI
jgi:MFS family permease